MSKVYNKGIPQGSSLGPMLWNIFVNDVLETDFGPRTRVQAFADDILLMIQAPASYCFRNESREALTKLDLWTKANDMTGLYFLKNKIQDFKTQYLVIRAQSFPFFNSFIPPWDKKCITWNIFNENITGTLIFTDGSRMNNKVGGAYVVYNNNFEISHHMFRLSDHATVFTDDLMAVNAAVDYCINNHLQASSIISDSRSVLLALDNVNNTDSDISKIKNKIFNHNGNIHLFWIKAHVGFAGNEKADEYAKEAT
ncbi:uncharacterized protein CDAR_410611 [Caerostris darwini]|uniref:RNase H type-1 domain-containing protein n=1 Tax=Caerostris darwini TaxID=1538125 RepID=A0AAV4NCG4_9ARAC|nr:uncharacterized protein CDAR_410611 [Caerostris darwini]